MCKVCSRRVLEVDVEECVQLIKEKISRVVSFLGDRFEVFIYLKELFSIEGGQAGS